MKKMICILLVISMLTLVFAFDMSAIPIDGVSELRNGSSGGSCYDVSNGVKANAWAYDPNGFNSIQLEHAGGGEWFDHGAYLGEMADVYSSIYSGSAEERYDEFSYYAWANYVRK